MQKEAREIVKVLSLEEKAGLCSGEDFWHLKSIKKAGLQKIMVTDGPGHMLSPCMYDGKLVGSGYDI
jgi:hypothetical protein